ncbi:MAG: hypothetical protein J3Q66DRAFT_437336 [Benniella sp.]|nr:MAG: hypothetical protein J3Q66DRAFT_437336 [Benniella sp.]
MGCLKEARQELEGWLQGESPDERFYESPLDTSLAIVPSFSIKKGRIFVDTKPFDRYWTMETPMATTVATAERFSVVSRLPLKLPSRFAIKDLDFGFSLFDYGEMNSIAAFLERCPDIERLVVPALYMSLCYVLLDLLPNWIHLKEMVIGEFYVEESALAEILRLASQSGRHYGRHRQQDQQQILNSVLGAGDSGDGLESLCIGGEDILTVSGPAPAIESVAWGWVCTRLRVLKLRYLPRETETGWGTGIPHELAVQLCRMRYLEDLRLGRMAGGMSDRPTEITSTSSALTSMSESVSTDISLIELNPVMKVDDENSETERTTLLCLPWAPRINRRGRTNVVLRKRQGEGQRALQWRFGYSQEN